MKDGLKWHADAVVPPILAEAQRRIRAACILVANRAKVLLNIDGTGSSGKGKLRYGASPSAPGEAPHKQRGRLLASVAWECKGLIGRVGTNLRYGRWLELGTPIMAARPWLRRALNESKSAIRTLIERH